MTERKPIFYIILFMIFIMTSNCSFLEMLWNPDDIQNIVDDTKGKLNIINVSIDPDSLVTGLNQKVNVYCTLDYDFTIVQVRMDISNLNEQKPVFLKNISNSLWFTNFSVTPINAGNFTLLVTASNDHKKIVSNKITIEVRDQTAIYINGYSGNDEYAGLIDFPIRTIQNGISIAQQKNITNLYISEGFYTNTNQWGHIISLQNFQSMYISGGWDTNFTSQNRWLYPSIIDGFKNIENLIYLYQSTNIILDGLIIQNASNDSTTLGGGITAYHSIFTLTNCSILSNQAKDGGGMYINQSQFLIINNVFNYNSSWFYGGGIHVENATGAIDNNQINYNHGYSSGGGLYLVDCDDVQILNSTFSFNTNITNQSGTGGWRAGAFYIYDSTSNVIISNCQISSNFTLGDGGGIYLLNSDPKLFHNTFTGNRAEGEGGGVALRYTSAPVIISNTFNNNSRYHMSELDSESAPSLLNYNTFQNESVIYHDQNGGGNITNADNLNLLDDNGYNPAGTIQGNS